MTYTASLSLDPTADLWAHARRLLADALRASGGPAAIARALAEAARAAFKRQLARLESLLMKLLLIEASKRAAEPPAPRARTAACADRAPTQAPPEDPADPETWRVRFHPRLPRPPQQGASAPPPARATPESRAQRKAHRLARRFEAIRRVIAAPQRAISTVARRLSALGAGAFAAARRIALARPPGGEAEGMIHADATVRACDLLFLWQGEDSS